MGQAVRAVHVAGRPLLKRSLRPSQLTPPARADEVVEAEEARGFALPTLARFRYRTRYFTDSGVIGTRRFVAECYRRFEGHFRCKHPRTPHPEDRLAALYSLKRLRAEA